MDRQNNRDVIRKILDGAGFNPTKYAVDTWQNRWAPKPESLESLKRSLARAAPKIIDLAGYYEEDAFLCDVCVSSYDTGCVENGYDGPYASYNSDLGRETLIARARRYYDRTLIESEGIGYISFWEALAKAFSLDILNRDVKFIEFYTSPPWDGYRIEFRDFEKDGVILYRDFDKALDSLRREYEIPKVLVEIIERK
ncbi:MAG: hypothetical protein AABX14_03980 [Candidatus Aenigmatarchaeota archaeon]